MAPKEKKLAQNPLIIRCHRLMEAFAKSDDERDFYLERTEGFILYVDLDKPAEDLGALETELSSNSDRYVMIPKLTFYEVKKIMEGFVNEKVYDIDTKEKLLEIISGREARENFLEFIYDHHSEMEKWQQFYQERFRIRIIEWLRQNHFEFVFEEDLDFPRLLLEEVKQNHFNDKPSKEVATARKNLQAKAKTYYSNEALNPRPKRGRPPKQVLKPEVEPQVSVDLFTNVPPKIRQFLFTPDISHASAITFSTKFETEEQMLARRKPNTGPDYAISIDTFNEKLTALRDLLSIHKTELAPKDELEVSEEDDNEEDEDDESEAPIATKKKAVKKAPPPKKAPLKKKK